jgi:hypothetical protein
MNIVFIIQGCYFMVESVMFVLISYMQAVFVIRKNFSDTRSYKKKDTEELSVENGLLEIQKERKNSHQTCIKYTTPKHFTAKKI